LDETTQGGGASISGWPTFPSAWLSDALLASAEGTFSMMKYVAVIKELGELVSIAIVVVPLAILYKLVV
jgi:hypothetical protein